MHFLTKLVDTITVMPVDAMIGGVFIALVLTCPVGLAYASIRRRAKDKDFTMTLVALAAAMNLVGMVVAIGFAQIVKERPSPNEEWAQTSFDGGGQLPPQPGSPDRASSPPGRPRLSDLIAEKVTLAIVSEWDIDRDGRLSTAEASAAVTALIRSSASDKGDSGGEEEIRMAVAEAIEPHLRALWQPQAAPASTEGKKTGSAATQD